MKDGRSRIKKRNWQNRGRHHRSGAEGRKVTVGGGMVGGGGWGSKSRDWQVKQNSLEGVAHLVNACNRSPEGNCQSGLPEVFLHFYFWQTMWFQWFYVTVSGTTAP